jgi:hypothetical protein
MAAATVWGPAALAVTQFNIATEGSPDAGVNNLLYSQKWGSGIGASAALLTSFSTAASAYSYAGHGNQQRSSIQCIANSRSLGRHERRGSRREHYIHRNH